MIMHKVLDALMFLKKNGKRKIFSQPSKRFKMLLKMNSSHLILLKQPSPIFFTEKSEPMCERKLVLYQKK